MHPTLHVRHLVCSSQWVHTSYILHAICNESHTNTYPLCCMHRHRGMCTRLTQYARPITRVLQHIHLLSYKHPIIGPTHNIHVPSHEGHTTDLTINTSDLPHHSTYMSHCVRLTPDTCSTLVYYSLGKSIRCTLDHAYKPHAQCLMHKTVCALYYTHISTRVCHIIGTFTTAGQTTWPSQNKM